MIPIPIIGAVVSGISGWFSKRQEIKQEKQVLASAVDARKDELKKLSLESKLKGVSEASESDMKMDQEANERISWGDDLTLILALLPCVLAFFPSQLPSVMAGFAALEAMPMWYKYALGMILASVWGYRRLVSPIILSITKAYLGKK